MLDWQKQTREIQKNQEKQLTDQERRMLAEQWRIEEQREKQIQ